MKNSCSESSGNISGKCWNKIYFLVKFQAADLNPTASWSWNFAFRAAEPCPWDRQVHVLGGRLIKEGEKKYIQQYRHVICMYDILEAGTLFPIGYRVIYCCFFKKFQDLPFTTSFLPCCTEFNFQRLYVTHGKQKYSTHVYFY